MMFSFSAGCSGVCETLMISGPGLAEPLRFSEPGVGDARYPERVGQWEGGGGEFSVYEKVTAAGAAV